MFIFQAGYSQQFTDFYDAEGINRVGFSYSVTVIITKVSEDDKQVRYTVQLRQVQPDSRGYYSPDYGKYYSCSVLGSFCDPSHFQKMIDISVLHECGGEELEGRCSFKSLNQTNTVSVRKVNCQSASVTGIRVNSAECSDNSIRVKYFERIKQLESPQSQSSAQSGSVALPQQAKPGSTVSYSNSNSYSPSSSSRSLSTYSATSSALQQERAQAIGQLTDLSVQVVGGIVGDIREARERKAQQREQQRVSDSIKKDQEYTARYNNRQNLMKNIIDENKDKAEAGDVNARILIIDAILRYSPDGRRDITSKHEDWLFVGGTMESFLYRAYLLNDEQLYEIAANRGSVDAMVWLGEYYNNKGTGNANIDSDNADEAFYWFERAANAGCPKAAYFLGMIYRYGSTGGGMEHFTNDVSYDALSTVRAYVVAYSIPQDLKKAAEWFGKSVVKEGKLIFETFKLSRFAETINETWRPDAYPLGSVAPAPALWELASMYKKGIGVEKNKKVAEAFVTLYYKYRQTHICRPNLFEDEE